MVLGESGALQRIANKSLDFEAESRLTKVVNRQESMDVDQYTTVMIRNVPCKYTQQDLIDEISNITPLYNFVYLPISKRGKGNANVGYAFVNFATPEAARLFIEEFDGYNFPKLATSTKVAEVVYAELQGLKENIKFYKRSKVRNNVYINRAL